MGYVYENYRNHQYSLKSPYITKSIKQKPVSIQRPIDTEKQTLSSLPWSKSATKNRKMEALNILQSVPFDDSVAHMEFHTHLPYASMTLNNNDEIRIPIQQQDLCVIPSMSYLYVEGKLQLTDKSDAPTKTKFINNAIAHLFDEIRYEINGNVIDRVRNPGITSTLKGYASLNENDLKSLSNAGWASSSNSIGSPLADGVTDANENFNFCIPLSSILGFAEDYKRIVVNTHHELVLIRSANDKNALKWTPAATTDTTPEDVPVKLCKLSWRIPYVTLSNTQQIELLKNMKRGASIPVEYRSRELYEYPVLPKSKKHSWTVKTASQVEKPRYVIVAIQTAKKNNMKTNAGTFDHCKLNNIKLHLNSISYPYDDLKLDIANNQYAVLYDMYTRFQESYYNAPTQPLLSRKEFKDYAPIIVIDCSKQNESIKTASVDIRLDFEVLEDIPENTTAYCLIIHEKSFIYDPSTNLVRKLE